MRVAMESGRDVRLLQPCFWSMRTEQQEPCNGIDVTVATVIMEYEEEAMRVLQQRSGEMCDFCS